MEQRPLLKRWAIISAIFTVLIMLFCGLVILSIIPLQFNLRTSFNPVITETFTTGPVTATPIVIRPSTTPQARATPTTSYSGPSDALGVPAIQATATPLPSAAEQNLETIQDAVIPLNDPISLAGRLEGKTFTVTTLEPPTFPLSVGAQQAFWVMDTDNNENIQVEAVLSQVSDHVYFWIEEGLDYNPRHMNALIDAFEAQIYPTTRAFIGSEWSPGVDGDPHLYILYVSGLGKRVAGLFSPRDEYTPQVIEKSNAHEMFLLNADNVHLDETYALSVLAHEFQHMIHWYQDRDEHSWLNEGFSGLAMYLNDFTTGGVEGIYANEPDVQLNHWPGNEGNSLPHYGASYLFVNYLWGRLGAEKTK